MRINKKVISLFVAVFFLFSTLMFFSFAAVQAPYQGCLVVTGNSCDIADRGVVSLYTFPPARDSHVDNYTPNAASSGLNNHLCCNYNGTDPYITTSYCEHQPLFTMWGLSNSHIGQNYSSGATYNVCLTSYDGFTQCDYRPSGAVCDATQTWVGSIDSYSPWNSHFGETNALDTNICCSFNTSLTLQGVNIAQFEYWCGVEDNVCPEDYYNSTGGHPVCYPREDPDC